MQNKENFHTEEGQKVNGPVLGIDLGTTNSCIAVFKGNGSVIIPNLEGGMTTPSIVTIEKSDSKVVVGGAAKRQMILKGEDTIFGAKRWIGKSYSDCQKIVDKHPIPYKLTAGSNGECLIMNKAGEKISPIRIGAEVLRYLKESAEKFLGHKVENVVITVPAYFDDSQRQATRDAGAIAGLNVVRIVNEPTAAALAYGLDKSQGNRTVVVYDLGGGTFDVSVLSINDGVFEVLATGGDTNLGGDDFNARLVNHLISLSGININNLSGAMKAQVLQRLYEAAEKAKIDLSFKEMTDISLPFLYESNHLECQITRAKFESLVEDLTNRTVDICNKVLKDSGCDLKDIHEVILVGGQTRMPKIQSKVKEFFKKEPCATVNPDEVVAAGAAVLGGVLSGNVSGKDVLLLDVLSLPLGIETLGGIFTKMIDSNTPIPTQKTETFSTAQDNQTTVTISVYQGERPMARDNKNLGQFDLSGIAPAPRGVPKIEVTFEIDVNGILNVTAKDVATNKEQKVTIHNSVGGLSKEEIQKMKEEAEKCAEADKKKLEMATLRNECDATIATARNALRDYTNIPSELKESIEKMIVELSELLTSENADAIKAKKEELNNKLTEIYQHIQQNSQQAQSNSETATNDDGQTQNQ